MQRGGSLLSSSPSRVNCSCDNFCCSSERGQTDCFGAGWKSSAYRGCPKSAIEKAIAPITTKTNLCFIRHHFQGACTNTAEVTMLSSQSFTPAKSLIFAQKVTTSEFGP